MTTGIYFKLFTSVFLLALSGFAGDKQEDLAQTIVISNVTRVPILTTYENLKP